MTLHYAPTTPEEEELALALALSASLSSAGNNKPISEPARNARASDSSARGRTNDCATEADQRRPAQRASTSPRRTSSEPGPPALNIPLSLNPSLIYPQLPPPPAHHKPSPPAAPPRPTPAASASAHALLQQQRPPGHAPQRPGISISPPRVRWGSDSVASSSGRATTSSQPASCEIQPAPSPGRSLSPSRLGRPPPPHQQYPPVQLTQYPPPQYPPPPPPQQHQPQYPPMYPPQHPHSHAPAPHLPPIAPPPPSIPRSKSATGPSGMFGGGGAGSSGRGTPAAATSTSTGGGVPAAAAAAAPPPPVQLHSDPDACAGCGRGFGLFSRSWVTGMGRKWHADCFKCGFCKDPISSGRGAFSYQMHPGDPLPYHPDCYRHVHHPLCHVCGTYITASPDGVIAYRENGFWREKYCTSHVETELTRCCACSRLQKQGEEWAPLPDGRPLCLQCLSAVVLDTPDAQPLYDDVLSFYAKEMRLPHAYKTPLLLVDGNTLNTHAEAEGRDDSGGAPVFHVRGLCVAHVYSHIPSILRGDGGTIRSIATQLLNPAASTSTSGARGSGGRVHCQVKVLLLLYGLPRLLSGSIMAHELMHAWLRMEGLVGLCNKVEEGLCQLMACLWLDRQHELLKGKPEEQRLASFFSYQIRTDTSEVYGDGFREAMEAFQAIGLMAVIQNVKRYGRFTA